MFSHNVLDAELAGLPSDDGSSFSIDLIDVKCDSKSREILVTVDFAQPFNGIVYSQGHFSDPNCQYVIQHQ